MKQKLRKYIETEDYDAIEELARENPERVMNRLIRFTYDKSRAECFRAVRAIGLCVRHLDMKAARSYANKHVWMMRDESGGNPWTSPEIVGALISERPNELKDLAPILGGFYEEIFFKAAVLRGVTTIARVKPELVTTPKEEELREALHEEDPDIRGNAVVLLGLIGAENFRDDLKKLETDNGAFQLFDGTKLVSVKISDEAKKVLNGAR